MLSTFAIVIAGISFVIVVITAYRNTEEDTSPVVCNDAPVPVSTLNPQDIVIITQSEELL